MTIHRLKWFKVGTTVRRMEVFDFKVVSIPVANKRKACILYLTQFDIGLRYFV